jgi:hypothetical protein
VVELVGDTVVTGEEDVAGKDVPGDVEACCALP